MFANTVFTIDPDNVKRILSTDFDNFQKGVLFYSVESRGALAQAAAPRGTLPLGYVRCLGLRGIQLGRRDVEASTMIEYSRARGHSYISQVPSHHGPPFFLKGSYRRPGEV